MNDSNASVLDPKAGSAGAAEMLVISKPQLRAALLLWERQARAGGTRTHEEADALPVEQVAQESADFLWGLLPGAETWLSTSDLAADLCSEVAASPERGA